MPKKKKRGTALPRVTLIAYNRRDLLAFTEAVEALRTLVGDLRIVAESMPKPRAKKPPTPDANLPRPDQLTLTGI